MGLRCNCPAILENVSEQRTESTERLERVFAYMVAGVIGASILSFIAVIIGSVAGAFTDGGDGEGIWPFVFMFPMIGLPLGFVLIIALMILSSVRRSREARQGKQ